MQSGVTADHPSRPSPPARSASLPISHSQHGSGSASGSRSPPCGGRGRPGGDSLGSVSGVPETPNSRANRIAEYEAMGESPSFGGGSDTGFIVSKTNWARKSRGNSPVARFPNEVLVHVLSFLEPSALQSASLISKRFYALVNSPHAWRSAFVRFFPPPHAQVDEHGSPLAAQDKRYFTRLSTADASENAWRKEYMQRTRLLRSLGKGKVQVSGITSNQTHRGLMVTYPARTGQLSVSHLAVNFALSGVRAVHASLESQIVTASDPTTGKIEKQPVSRDLLVRAMLPGIPDLRHVRNDHPDYGVAVDMNVNRVMDISEELGWIMGENVPDGKCYAHPCSSPYINDETRSMGRFILPDNYGHKPLVTCVWMAKKRSGGVRDTTGAAAIVGNSRGFIRIFSMNFGRSTTNVKQIKAFCICPGVPIVQVKVDEDFLPRRFRQGRPWIIVINAFGEVYYLRGKPENSSVEDWKIIPQTARIPTAVYADVFPDLPEEDLKKKHDQRIELLLKMDYFRIKDLWEGCRMDWFLEVDWAGENIITGRTGSESYWHGALVGRADVPLKRYHLHKAPPEVSGNLVRVVRRGSPEFTAVKQSIFGGGDRSGSVTPLAEIPDDDEGSIGQKVDEWLVTELHIHDASFMRITAHSLDNSHLARLTSAEDPTLREGLPGGNGRLFAVGTNAGTIFVFNIRPTSAPAALELPIRTIHTNSPQISTLAISSLVVVHGGDDGLVQAWDPLGSTQSPVRTLNSRFSARARRRIDQNVGVVVADNQFAARCLVLDPNPTSLRGAVALGTFVRYWSFSVHNGGSGHKKRRKRFGGGVGGEVGGGRSCGPPSRNKGAIRDVIHSDELALQRDRDQELREAEKLEKRYGVAIGEAALSEEEMVAYAQMISQEAFEMEARAVGVGVDEQLERALRESLKEVGAANGQAWDESSCSAWSPPGKGGKSVDCSPPTAKKASPWELLEGEHWPSVGCRSTTGGSPHKEGRRSRAVDQEFEDDLELAIRLSLIEAEEGEGKGKGRV